MKMGDVIPAVLAGTIIVTGSISPAFAQDTLFAVLSGASVCNMPSDANPPLCRLGNPLAVGSATVLITGPTSLCATIIVDKLKLSKTDFPTGAHIHIGQASYSGPVIVQLPVPKANGGGSPGTSMACVSDVAADMITALSANPQFFYIDVHGEGRQFGALRGQLF